MNLLAHTIYNYLPHFLKEIAAGYYATKLHRLRRNQYSNALIQQAAERESFSFTDWETYQTQQLSHILKYAVQHIPYYQKYWNEHPKALKNEDWKDLNNWPILTKQELRKNNPLFVQANIPITSLYHEVTSGTSGTPIQMYWSKETALMYYAIFERRIRNWHGINWDMPYVMIGGRMIIPVKQQKPPFWIHNRPMNQLYLSSYHLSKQHIKAYHQKMLQFAPKYMYGYASSMYSLALLIKEEGLEPLPLLGAISNAEPLLLYQKELIASVFKCPVIDTYGMSELVAAGNSFQSSNLILWPEVGKIEVVDYHNAPLKNGEQGRFICTSLLNTAMPLIRYEIGDSGSIVKTTEQIHHFAIQELSGRIDDLIITPDGRRIGRLDPVFKGGFKIREAQIVQTGVADLTIKVVADKGFSHNDIFGLTQSLKERVGEMTIKVEQVNKIERTNTGKFKAVINLLKT